MPFEKLPRNHHRVEFTQRCNGFEIAWVGCDDLKKQFFSRRHVIESDLRNRFRHEWFFVRWICLDDGVKPHDVAEAVAYLLGPRSNFVNGTVLKLDGGIR